MRYSRRRRSYGRRAVRRVFRRRGGPRRIGYRM